MPLPTPTDDMEAKVVENVRKHGWHVVLVRAGVHDHETEGPWAEHPTARAAYEATFAYTVGLMETFGHAEVILVGGWQHAHAFLNVVGDLVGDGRRITAGDRSEDVLDGFTVRFDTVGEARDELLTLAHWAVGRQPFEALQLVLPDTSGRWPEDPDYDAFDQPILA